MKINKPTDKQREEFWERFGWVYRECNPNHPLHKTSPYGMGWFHPIDEGLGFATLQPITLETLFKYAVPELKRRLSPLNYALVLYGWLHQFVETNEDPALSLFWAIWEAIKG